MLRLGLRPRLLVGVWATILVSSVEAFHLTGAPTAAMKLSHKYAALSRPRPSLVCVPAGVCACCDVDAILNENSAVLLSLSHCLSRCLLLSALFLFRPVLAPSFPPRPLYTALTPSLQMPLRSRATIAMQHETPTPPDAFTQEKAALGEKLSTLQHKVHELRRVHNLNAPHDWAAAAQARLPVPPLSVFFKGFLPVMVAAALLQSTAAVAEGGSSAELARTVCEETYGLLPCSLSAGGNLFLMAAYGFLLFTAAGLISEGSELLLEVLDPGIVGGLLLPVLGAFADCMIVLVSAIGGTVEEAQEEVAVGLGVLAGSTVMLLTIAWAGSLWAGRCDLTGPDGTAVNRKLSEENRFSLENSGVTTDKDTRNGALIMGVSCLPYLFVQIPLIDGHPAEGPEAALAGAACCAIGFVAYSAYQIYFPVLQKKKMEDARYKIARARAVRKVEKAAMTFGGIVNSDGTPNEEGLRKVFASFDLDSSGRLSKSEVEALLVGLASERAVSSQTKQEVDLWMQSFDVDGNGFIDLAEFSAGMTKWVKGIKKKSVSELATEIESAKSLLQSAEVDVEEIEGDEDEEEELDLTPAEIYKKAGLTLLAGTLLVAVFADPMVDAVGNFGKATGIPAFFVAFVVTPFASNASEVVSSFIFAAKKRKRTISLTYSQIYGAITMNNTLCLGIFLALVYARGLTWDFSAEVTAILATVLGMTAVGASQTTFKLSYAPPVLAVYPAVIVGILAMENLLGWH
eukprot:Tamp_06753.p1 GENE.Tamp_06753~~Tamp_06753.p1  ORF type:complete len:742 (+),score=146.07 Tamp_06753:3-2228(+)